jgi:hypothetical protein
MSVSAPVNLAAPFDLENFLRQRTRSLWLSFAILVFAVLQQAVGHVNSDDAWFMTFAETFLAGETPYIDISDPNPPAGFLVYVPSIILARALGLAPEPVLIFLTFAGAISSIFISGLILKRCGLLRPEETSPALAASAFVLLAVPALCFAEREHFAIISFLPMLAICAGRAAGRKVALSLAILAGLGAGLGIALKPYYALPLGLAILCTIFRQRSVRLAFSPEVFVTTAVIALYFLAIVQFFPAYFTQAIPLIVDLYVPARESLTNILRLPHFIANLVLLAALLIAAQGRFKDSRLLVLFAASLGFLATFLIQSKGWMNHSYPGLALALLGSVFFLLGDCDIRDADTVDLTTKRRFALFVFAPVLCVAPFVFGALVDWRNEEEYPGLKSEVARLAPEHPKIAVLAEELTIGHPLVRQLGGIWVGRQNCLWVSYTAKYLLAQEAGEARRSRLLLLKDADETMFVEDVFRGKPDVLLVETQELEAWARREPNLSAVFNAYHLAGRVQAVSIWLRDKSI